ncbi:hypothetical protein SAMN05444008_11058 [Cnuella takakiae]|uniref:Uncharacterized protein n=1 Tax=Cnuella takakiae TaxID=1302690 RepID=A0A1M5D354_9BACT|nr:hypothetical protein SAMN05444008_11058 [Cnuella takakiae]
MPKQVRHSNFRGQDVIQAYEDVYFQASITPDLPGSIVISRLTIPDSIFPIHDSRFGP